MLIGERLLAGRKYMPAALWHEERQARRPNATQFSQDCESCTNWGADPRSARVPLDPLLAKRNQHHPPGQADEGVGCGPGVRPTINADCPILTKLSGIGPGGLSHTRYLLSSAALDTIIPNSRMSPPDGGMTLSS